MKIINKMAKTQTQTTDANANANDNNDNTDLTVREIQSPVPTHDVTFDMQKALIEVDKQLEAEMQADILALGVSKLTSATSLIDGKPNEPLAKSAMFSMLDAFPFTLQENDVEKQIIVYVIQIAGSDEVLTVGQGWAGSRAKFIDVFNKVRMRGGKLVMTNLYFERLDKGGKAGNFPIVIRTSPSSQPIFTPNAAAV